MFSKAVAIVLVIQSVAVFSAPPGSPDTVVTTVVNGNRNMQDLLDSLSAPVPTTTTTGGKVIKKTTTTTTTTTTNKDDAPVSEVDQLRVLLKNPEFAQQLREFLFQFLKMYNALHKGSETTQTITTTENLDIPALMNNPSFVQFLGGFFGNSQKTTGTGMASIVNELINEEKNAEKSSTNSQTTVTEESVVNGNSRPVEVVVKPVETVATGPDSLIDQITSSSSTKTSSSTSSTTATNPAKTVITTGTTNFPSRFYTDDVTVTTNREPSVSTSENVLNELRKQVIGNQRESNKVVSTTTTTTNTNNRYGYDEPTVEITRPSVIITRPATSVIDDNEQWSKVNTVSNQMSAEEMRQQAKNAKYQFATQIDDSISGNFQQRAEIRENGVVYGKYSYDDGFNWRTVYYEDDGHGFTITKQDVRPSHIKTLTGEASVQTLVNGNLVDYHITAKDINNKVPIRKEVYTNPVLI
ncbi:unnamed protein product [Diabrotica balteata]|uniref:Uncharacterized protein n=1 Tax=Diabrotica balteata TaxID=107213 RepID=A0A9P0GS92_DIABA|nr:unnamed protein product [Diabrotica balteata]